MSRERKVHRLAIKEHPTTLASALAYCPGYHAFWSWWLVSLCHLRPTEGFPPAHLFVEGATHEIVTQVINPERCPTPDPAAWEQGYPVLSPADVVVQFTAQDDAGALQIFEALCLDVTEGRLSPDSDYRRLWKTRVRILCGGQQ